LKKNVLPLVVIALVVAVLSTGIFYGLIVSRMDGSSRSGSSLRYVATRDLEKGQVVTGDDFRLAPAADPGSPAPTKPEDLVGRKLRESLGAGGVFTEKVLTPFSQRGISSGIPDGLRAVTVHISESSSVVSLLRPGDHIDIQALLQRQRGGEPDLEIRTLLQNAVVFNVSDGAGSQQGKAILTVLSTPQDAERLSLADAGARLRVSLRKQGDEKIVPLGGSNLLGMGGGPRSVVTSSFVPVIPGTAVPSTAGNNVARTTPQRSPSPKVSFEVSLIQTNSAQGNSTLAVKSFGLEEWRTTGSHETVSTSRVEADRAGEFVWRADQVGSLRVRLEPMPSTTEGEVQVRVQPEVTSLGKTGASVRRVESNVALGNNQVAVVSGLVPDGDAGRWREHLGARQGANGELLLLIRSIPNKADAAK
jgi:Flp pilus assembly protein CpaB